jgi:hypothetical protein
MAKVSRRLFFAGLFGLAAYLGCKPTAPAKPVVAPTGEPLGSLATFAYECNGQLRYSSYLGGQTTTWVYDSMVPTPRPDPAAGTAFIRDSQGRPLSSQCEPPGDEPEASQKVAE